MAQWFQFGHITKEDNLELPKLSREDEVDVLFKMTLVVRTLSRLGIGRNRNTAIALRTVVKQVEKYLEYNDVTLSDDDINGLMQDAVIDQQIALADKEQV